KWFGDNSQFAVHNSQLILLQPGARWENKRWPANNFAELIRRLAQKIPDARFAILGSAEDKPLGEKIISGAGILPANPRAQDARATILNLCGATSLPEMIEWVRLCD